MNIYDVHEGCFFWLPQCWGFACHVVRGFPSIAPGLEHVFAGGGVV